MNIFEYCFEILVETFESLATFDPLYSYLGWETFLSYEDPTQDILVGLLRLRKCSEETFRPELKGGCSIVRELHVYGSVVPVSTHDPTKFQHQVSKFCGI